MIASDIPVVREALGSHSTFLHPDDVPAWRKAMADHARSRDCNPAAVLHAHGLRDLHPAGTLQFSIGYPF